MRKFPILAIVSLATLAACDRSPQAPSAEENRQLDEAEAMLDDAPEALDAIDDGALIEKNSAGPNVSVEAPEPADPVLPNAS